MTLQAGQTIVKSTISAADQVTAQTGFPAGTCSPVLTFSVTPDATVYNNAIPIYVGTIAASGSATVDFYSAVTALNLTVTSTKLIAVIVKATATVTGGQLEIAPGAANPLNWPLSGTTPAITLDVGTGGCSITLCNGVTVVLSTTVRNWLISNPGTQTITVSLLAIVGT